MEAVDSCKRSHTYRKSRIKHQRAREPQKYARTSMPWIHRGVARTKAATVQTTSNRERTKQTKAEQPISSHTLAYGLEEQRIPPGRPSMNATVEGRERQTRRRSQRRGQRRHTHWVEGASQALVKPSQHAARKPLEHRTTLAHTQILILKRRVDVVSYHKIYLFKNYHF